MTLSRVRSAGLQREVLIQAGHHPHRRHFIAPAGGSILMTDVLAATLVLAVRDLARSRRFYTEQLGFTEELAVDGWSFLSRGACSIRLGHCPDTPPVSPDQDAAWFAYLHVDDAQALHDEFAAAGAPIWQSLQDRPWGCREFAVLTPDGHRIVFGQDLEAPEAPA